MPLANLDPADTLGLVEVLDPDGYGPGSNGTDWIDGTKAHGYLIVALYGTLQSTAIATVQQATDASGTGSKALATTSVTSADDSQQVISLLTESLDVAGGFTHFMVTITGGGNTDAAVAVFAFGARQGTPRDLDATSVDELVRV